VWDPHHQVHKRSLESVQRFAARIITTDWKADYPSLCAKLNMKTLATHHRIQKLKVCYNIINNLSCLPSNMFTPHPHPSSRLHHSKPLFSAFVSTMAHRYSFFIDVIPHWNSLPDSIVSCSSASSFKHHLHKHFLTYAPSYPNYLCLCCQYCLCVPPIPLFFIILSFLTT